jgi:tRNA threonylcarbamoyl adenosine modification protein (Sua5/YciO/YrdC/YwlC family)
VLRTDLSRPDAALLDQAAGAILAGGLVVAPTETRYGLLVRADRQEYLEKLYSIKKRELSKATALLVRDMNELGSLGRITRAAARLAGRFLPGPLTLILEARRDWPPPRVVEGRIGLRWSSAAIIQQLLARLDVPVTATSANISGRPDHESVEGIASDFGDLVSLYIDVGPLAGSSSTVVDCSGLKVNVLREGAIGRREVEQALGDLDG